MKLKGDINTFESIIMEDIVHNIIPINLGLPKLVNLKSISKRKINQIVETW